MADDTNAAAATAMEAGTRARARAELGLTSSLLDQLLASWSLEAAESGLKPADRRYWDDAWEFLLRRDGRVSG